jgi:hypothetical protein
LPAFVWLSHLHTPDIAANVRKGFGRVDRN